MLAASKAREHKEQILSGSFQKKLACWHLGFSSQQEETNAMCFPLAHEFLKDYHIHVKYDI